MSVLFVGKVESFYTGKNIFGEGDGVRYVLLSQASRRFFKVVNMSLLCGRFLVDIC